MTGQGADSQAATPTFTGRCFGLDIGAGFAIPGVLEPAPVPPVDPRAHARPVTVTLTDASAIAREWPSADTERTFTLGDDGGAPVFTIHRHPASGLRVRIADLGECLIAGDGTHIAYAPPGDDALRWRLLLGQGFPIAAALAGLEVLHASAVVFDGRALAFSAPPGVGKTATAMGLIAHGAEFLADDVVALELGGEVLIAHSGAAIAHVSGAGGKRHVAVPVQPRAAPLGAIYFLNRAADVSHPDVVALSPPDPRLLLGATFVAHVPTAARLITQLEVCSRLARTVPVFRIDAPRDGDPETVAALVAEHARAHA